MPACRLDSGTCRGVGFGPDSVEEGRMHRVPGSARLTLVFPPVELKHVL